jgi:hypothetical protein
MGALSFAAGDCREGSSHRLYAYDFDHHRQAVWVAQRPECHLYNSLSAIFPLALLMSAALFSAPTTLVTVRVAQPS